VNAGMIEAIAGRKPGNQAIKVILSFPLGTLLQRTGILASLAIRVIFLS